MSQILQFSWRWIIMDFLFIYYIWFVFKTMPYFSIYVIFYFLCQLCFVDLFEYSVFLAYSYMCMYMYALTFFRNRLIQGVWLVTLCGFQYLFDCIRFWSHYVLCAFMLTSTFVCSIGLCYVRWLVCRVVRCTPELRCVQCSCIITLINTITDILRLIWLINPSKMWEVQIDWRIKDQLDATCYFISLLMCSTCFGH